MCPRDFLFIIHWHFCGEAAVARASRACAGARTHTELRSIQNIAFEALNLLLYIHLLFPCLFV